MLILFKPWCAIQHLKNVHDSWIDAFEMFVDQCGVRLRKIMDNMQLLHECKDSRDDHFSKRQEGRNRSSRVPLEMSSRGGGPALDEDEEEFTEDLILEHLQSIDSCRLVQLDRSMENVISCL
jgi:hypothetical protein